jgi:hypothetical protein
MDPVPGTVDVVTMRKQLRLVLLGGLRKAELLSLDSLNFPGW